MNFVSTQENENEQQIKERRRKRGEINGGSNSKEGKTK